MPKQKPERRRKVSSKDASSQESPLLRLPTELLSQIIETVLLSWHEATNRSSRRPDSLVPLTIVCRVLRDVAQPLLLRRIVIDDAIALRDATSWARRQHEAGRVGVVHLSVGTIRAGTVSHGTRHSITELGLADLLQTCPFLETLDIDKIVRCGPAGLTPDLTLALRSPQKLERLQYGVRSQEELMGLPRLDPGFGGLLDSLSGHKSLRTLAIDAVPQPLQADSKLPPIFPNLSYAIIALGTDPWILEPQPSLRFLHFRRPEYLWQAAGTVVSSVAPRLEGLALDFLVDSLDSVECPQLKVLAYVACPFVSFVGLYNDDSPRFLATIDTLCFQHTRLFWLANDVFWHRLEKLKRWPHLRTIVLCFQTPNQYTIDDIRKLAPPDFECDFTFHICRFPMLDMEAWVDRRELAPFGCPDEWYFANSSDRGLMSPQEWRQYCHLYQRERSS